MSILTLASYPKSYMITEDRATRFPSGPAGDIDVTLDTGVTYMSTSQPAGGFTQTGTIASASDRRRVVFATVVGTTVEWYDFFIYASAAGLVFGQLFFAPLGANSVLISFATVGVS